ncbi:MAG: hypothetical protein WDN06_12460 [Asticcacaulis sp.]
MQANASQHGGRYAAAYGQWDASLNYTLTPKLILSFEALNINKATSCSIFAFRPT